MDTNITDDATYYEQINILLNKINELTNRAGPKAHTQATIACLEDALAVLSDVLISETEQREYTLARLRQLAKILQTGREGPYAYPVDQVAGERPRKGYEND